MNDKEKNTIESQIMAILERWKRLSKLYHVMICILGATGVCGGLFVSIFLGVFADKGEDKVITLKIISFLSSASIGLLTAFDMVNKRNKYRAAWRFWYGKYMLYENESISIEQLLQYYEHAEQMVGNLNYSFNTTTSKNDS